jgi:hypothetical protein
MLYLKSLGVAFLGGAANAFTTVLSATLIAPDKFNIQDTQAIINLVSIIVVQTTVGGLGAVAAYLKQSPIKP